MYHEAGDNKTILIVDDIPANLNILFDYLSLAGFKTLVAESGPDALGRAQHAQPDLILMDVMMPGMNGFETCRQLKNIESTKNIPIIFITALSDTASMVEGFDAGGVDYITKPFRHKEVLARINTHLTIRNLQIFLQIRNQDLGAFARTVAHDLQNPLNRVIGFAELLNEEHTIMSANELQEHFDTIIRAGHQMNQIINSLLLLADTRNQKIGRAPLDMADIVDSALRRLDDVIETHQTEIILPKTWPEVIGYAPWVEEVWANYLSNALKYGGQSPSLKLGSAPQPDGQIRFWVQDKGPGIAPENQDKLFNEFYRLTPSQAQGYGLGLSIVKRIIDRLGGKVGVESQIGEGSLFYFTLKK